VGYGCRRRNQLLLLLLLLLLLPQLVLMGRMHFRCSRFHSLARFCATRFQLISSWWWWWWWWYWRRYVCDFRSSRHVSCTEGRHRLPSWLDPCGGPLLLLLLLGLRL